MLYCELAPMIVYLLLVSFPRTNQVARTHARTHRLDGYYALVSSVLDPHSWGKPHRSVFTPHLRRMQCSCCRAIACEYIDRRDFCTASNSRHRV